MSLEIDEEEHSFEMHAPYIYKLTQFLPQGIPKIVPIMISHSSESFNIEICDILSQYFRDESNTFVISSDFCHWGSRFGYTKYTPTGSLDDLISLGISNELNNSSNSLKVYKSIEVLDKSAMKIASTGSSKKWKDYIKTTGNTICGQKPIELLLRIIEKVREDDDDHSKDWGTFKWIGYSQSSKPITFSDSSVSYASAFAVV
ncbi:hypothetical protein WICMUC_005182 [Wickerhamomyces mucosus]|uniref:MEMO1 family protein n=1 Tax=Wickerhamomyces mucosus TaxID=1378264 RepID=A0A9P8PAW7_9ASCO|nr:hypothetical protein WICMUC_005182 [Wickerhamomyces mucosus]